MGLGVCLVGTERNGAPRGGLDRVVRWGEDEVLAV